MEGDNTTMEWKQYQPKTDQNQHLIDEVRMGKSKNSFAKSPTKKERRTLGTKIHPFRGNLLPKIGAKKCTKTPLWREVLPWRGTIPTHLQPSTYELHQLKLNRNA